MQRIVVLVVDGLGGKYLGPYGNTWIETQAFNQLAADSLLLDNVYAPFSDGSKTLDALWRGNNALGQHVEQLAGTSLIRWLEQRGFHTRLFTDDADVLDAELAADFGEQLEVETAAGVKLASEWDETHTAQFFAQAIDCIRQQKDKSLLWIHCRGLMNPWDAPYEFRAQYAEEEDPDPSGSAQVPSLKLDAEYDPDTLHEIQCALAGQVALLDQCLGVLVSVLQTEADDVFFMMTSPRGFPMGEHLRVGCDEPILHHESLWVPAYVRFPQRKYALQRRGGLNEHRDLPQLLAEWVSGEKPRKVQTDSEARLYSVSQGDADVLLRTPPWQLRIANMHQEQESVELYLKPDDQNEVNDVADRCTEVVDAGRAFLRDLLATSTDQQTDIALPDVLLEPLE